MKTIDELGISPWPWRISKICKASVMDADYSFLVHYSPFTMEYRPGGEMICDSTLIAAAPELYEALREAVIDVCDDCLYCERKKECKYDCTNNDGYCHFMKWRAALAKASGEDEK